MKRTGIKLNPQKDAADEEFQLILDHATLSARKRSFRLNLPFAISESGVLFLIYPDGRKVQPNDKLLFNDEER